MQEIQEKFENIKGVTRVTRIRNLKKDRQYNGQKKKNRRTHYNPWPTIGIDFPLTCVPTIEPAIVYLLKDVKL
jgi:hypothetical protein